MQSQVCVECPVRGRWGIFNPPGHPRIAIDLIAINESRSPYRSASLCAHLFSRIHVADTYAWGETVHAAANGIVVAAHDGEPDRLKLSFVFDLLRLMLAGGPSRKAFPELGGNFVVQEVDGGFALYAHLKKGSVRVKVGQHVATGDTLGQVGNSGSSIQPHLHFQVMSSQDPLPLYGNLIPFTFRTLNVIRSRQPTVKSPYLPTNGDHLQYEVEACVRKELAG